jgi:hypothetical protein
LGHSKLGRLNGASEQRGGDKGAATNFPSWAACEAGPERRKGKEKGFAYLERDSGHRLWRVLQRRGWWRRLAKQPLKQMKFKFKFEFHQTNSMHQHVCNKHHAIYLIWKNK